MKRKLFTFASAVSLLLCLTFCALVAVSYWRVDEYTALRQTWETPDDWRGRQVSAHAVRGRWVVRWGYNAVHLAHAAGEATAADVAAMRADAAARGGWSFRHTGYALTGRSTIVLVVNAGRPLGERFGFTWYHDATSTPFRASAWTNVVTPAWISAAIPFVLTILPACWLRAALRRRRLGRVGLCPACGYDLRASPGGCPECGVGRDAA